MRACVRECMCACVLTYNIQWLHSHLICTSNPCEASLVYVCGWCNFFIIVTGAIVRTVILYILVYVSFE